MARWYFGSTTEVEYLSLWHAGLRFWYQSSIKDEDNPTRCATASAIGESGPAPPLRPESKTTIAWPSITFGLIAGTGCSAQAFGCPSAHAEGTGARFGPASSSAQREGCGLLTRRPQLAQSLRPNAKAEKSIGAKFASSQTEPSEQSKMFRAVGVRPQVLSFGGSEANQTSHFVLLLLVSLTLW